jgi:hypothetical protein
MYITNGDFHAENASDITCWDRVTLVTQSGVDELRLEVWDSKSRRTYAVNTSEAIAREAGVVWTW